MSRLRELFDRNIDKNLELGIYFDKLTNGNYAVTDVNHKILFEGGLKEVIEFYHNKINE